MKRRYFIRNTAMAGLAWGVFPDWGDGGDYLKISYQPSASGFGFFCIDATGKGRLSDNLVLPVGEGVSPGWAFGQAKRSFTLASRYMTGTGPFVFDISQQANHASLLGLVAGASAGGNRIVGVGTEIALPAVLHFPDRGSLRISCTVPGLTLRYESKRFVDKPYVRVLFPPATAEMTAVTYHFEVVTIHPDLGGREKSELYDGFRTNFISIFQLNPLLGMLANNSASDACAFTLYEYSEVALQTPPLAKGLLATDLLRQTLDRYLAGQKGYGLPGYDYDKTWEIAESGSVCATLDSYPSLLIAACNYVAGSGDRQWFRKNEARIQVWADKMLAADINGDGLLEYCLSGNSGSWKGDKTMRPANWWDTIGFGYQDAYSNALAYRALVLLERTYRSLSDTRADIYKQKAGKLKAVYSTTFYNPVTGVLAGWKSEDGKLHDYYFTFVNGMAICHGLIEPPQANRIMDHLLQKMQDSGYADFSLGLPGNLVPVRRADYTDLLLEVGGGQREDNQDGFQIYENGGATSCFAYYTIHALQQLGRKQEADKILLPMLKSLSAGNFQGRCANGRSKDWKTWKGECWGYEGFLADSYHFLLAVMRPVVVMLLLLLGYNTEAQTKYNVKAQPDTICKRVKASQLSIVNYNLRMKAKTDGYSFLRCYDNGDKLLLEYKMPFKAGDSTSGNYTETAAGTGYLTIGVKGANVDSIHLELNSGEKRHQPLCNIDEYLLPFWKGDTVYNETILLTTGGAAPASGELLYQPDKVLAVRNFGLDTLYREGIDYRLEGRTLLRQPGSGMSFRQDSSFDRHNLAWYTLQGQWVTVTYTHHDVWTGPKPAYQGGFMPRLMARLQGGRPVTIVSYGMSITRGMDVSGYDGVAPYMPTYMELFAAGLRRRWTRSNVRLYNAGLPGATVEWGAKNAAQYINPLHPDLVVIDFGMNDFWRMAPMEFRDSVRTIIRTVRRALPAAEFLLLSNMKFDPDYVADTDSNKVVYMGNLAGYHELLKGLEGRGIIGLDMTNLSDVIYRRKKAKDCIVNPLHPNDYLARWYAQGMIELFCP